MPVAHQEVQVRGEWVDGVGVVDKITQLYYMVEGPVLTFEQRSTDNFINFVDGSSNVVLSIDSQGNVLTNSLKQNTTSGLTVVASGEKLAFYGSTPVVKQSIGSTVSGTITDTATGSYTTTEQGMLNDLKAQVNALTTALASVQDKLKSVGLFS
jgi:hypothetical protein